MAALTVGAIAPDFTLPAIGGSQVVLREARKHGPVVAAFFKISCPVCQLAFPFLERLHQAYQDKNVTVLGISQNDESGTRAFMKEYGITFPVLLDDHSRYPVSNAFGLTNVPTVFLITPDGQVEQSIVGWDRSEMEQLNRRVAELAGATPSQLFRPGEDVPQFKAG
jgi:peroxiredoxin